MAEWFRRWFDEDYLSLYPHRDDADAARLASLITRHVRVDRHSVVIDIACGPGRHLAALADLSDRCYGIDLSMVLLRRARAVTTAGLVQADMRWLPLRPGAADVVVNLFTSFGYFETDAEHERALCEMTSTLRPGGWFIIDYLNAARVRETLVARETADLNGVRVDIQRSIVGAGTHVQKVMTAADGRRWEERVRLFTIDDLASFLSRAGVTIIHRFGDYDGVPPSSSSPRAVLLGRRS